MNNPFDEEYAEIERWLEEDLPRALAGTEALVLLPTIGISQREERLCNILLQTTRMLAATHVMYKEKLLCASTSMPKK